MRRNVAGWIWGCLLLWLTGCLPGSALPPRASPPGFDTENVAYESMFTYEGFSLGPLRVVRFRQTPVVDGAQVTRMRIDDERGTSIDVSCLMQARRHQVRRMCAVEHGSTTSLVVLAGATTAPLSGSVRGAIALNVEGLSKSSMLLATYTPALEVRRGAKTLGAIVSLGPMTKLRSHPRTTQAERRWLRTLALIQAVHADPRDWDADTMNGSGIVLRDPPPPGDAYDLRARRTGDASRSAAHLETLGEFARALDHRGDDEAATQLRRLRMLDRDHVFDEEAGAYNQRHAVRGVVMEVASGVIWAPDPDGRPSSVGIDGGHFRFGGGLRLWERTSVTIGAGIQSPAFSFAGAGAKYGAPAGSYLSIAFDFEMALRHGFASWGGGVEPVLGLSLQARGAFLEYAHPTVPVNETTGDTVGGALIGLGVEPIIGLQWATPLNPIGSRFVCFFELRPEVMFWPARSANDNSDGAVAEAPAVVELFERIGEDPTFQMGTALGVRLEL